MSENKKTLFQQLSKIQQDLKAPKNQYNKFGGFHYRSCEDIVEAVKPLLGNSFLTLTDKIIRIGKRYYIKATATISDGETQISVSAYAREPLDKKGMNESQLTGATSSYARKYALNGLFAIDDAKDADAEEIDERNPRFGDEKLKPYLAKVRELKSAEETEEFGKKLADTKKLTIKEKLIVKKELDEKVKDLELAKQDTIPF